MRGSRTLALGVAALTTVGCQIGNTAGVDGRAIDAPVDGGLEVDAAGGADGPADQCGELIATIRDFRADHPDFEDAIADDRGLVRVDLGADRKPVYAPAGATATVSGAASFDQWYRDVPGVNLTFAVPLVLAETTPGQFVFEDLDFFPIDGRGWPNEEVFGCQNNECSRHGLCASGSRVTSAEVYGKPENGEIEVTRDTVWFPGDADDCSQSDGCAEEGNCSISADGKRCVAASDADCARSSRWCKGEGTCGFEGGGCVAKSDEGCRASKACTDDGHCSVGAGVCIAKSDDDCKSSAACKAGGLCELNPDIAGYCHIKDEAACRASTGCTGSGMCHFDSGHCVITDADCKKSSGCAAEGRCLKGGFGYCVGNDTTCKASQLCATEGRCRWGKDNAYGCAK